MDIFLIYSPYGETVAKSSLSDEDKRLESDGELEIYKISAPQAITLSRITFGDDLSESESPLEVEPVG